MSDRIRLTKEALAQQRNRRILEQARLKGLIGATKDTRVAGRVSTRLVEAAKRRAHIESDSELLELALSKLALEDDFGPRLLRLKGRVAADIDLAF